MKNQERILKLLERIDNHNVHTDPDHDINGDLLDELHDCIDLLQANEDKQPAEQHCNIDSVSVSALNPYVIFDMVFEAVNPHHFQELWDAYLAER